MESVPNAQKRFIRIYIRKVKALQQGGRMTDSKKRALRLWQVNEISFVLFAFLAATGLVNAYILPRGFRGEGGVLVSLRHLLAVLHEWIALAFICVIGLHLFLHWPYLRTRLKGGATHE